MSWVRYKFSHLFSFKKWLANALPTRRVRQPWNFLDQSSGMINHHSSYFKEADAPTPVFSEEKRDCLTGCILGTCPTTQPYFITATLKGSWGLASSVVSLRVSLATIGDRTLCIYDILYVRRSFVAVLLQVANNLTSHFLY